MAIFVEGVRGSGKSKIAIREIQTYLKSGRRVATNLDVKLELLAPGASPLLTRIPDLPRSLDLEHLGKAYPELDPDNPDTYDEKKFGLVVIDELLTSFNSRSWADKDRLAVVSWMVQSRKLGWRLWLLCQDVDAVDKQIRETLLQEIWHCRSGKNFFSSPIMGAIFGLFTRPIMKIWAPLGFHILTVYTGKRKDKVHIAAREFYKLYDLHQTYKTSQQFLPDIILDKKGNMVDMRASYTPLPGDYFTRQKPQELTPAPTANLHQFSLVNSLVKDWRFLAFIICLASYFLVLSPGQTVQTVNDTSNQNKSPSQVNLPGESPSSDVPSEPDAFDQFTQGLVITCSVTYGTAQASFCFENQDGTVYPEDIGYQVSYLAPCQALIAFNGQTRLIRCRPNYVPSESVAALPTQNSQG